MPRSYNAQAESKYWCFTLNNPTPEDDNTLDFEAWPTKPTFAIYNLEIGENQTPHYQGYLELPHTKNFQWIRTRIPRAHLEKRKGSREQAILYCLKECQEENGSNTPSTNSEDGHTTEWLNGILSNLSPTLYGYSHSWKELKNECQYLINLKIPRKQALAMMRQMITEGATDEELANFHFSTWVQCYRALRTYRLLISKPRDFKPKVIVCQGPTGTGKSKWCKDSYPSAYWKPRSQWWCGYSTQEVVVIDEFYGWLPYDLLLRLCDRYPLEVETKGGNVNFVAKVIIFTTNQLPSSWYKNVYFPSFARRVDEWHIFPVWGMHIFYNSYEDALPNFYNNQ